MITNYTTVLYQSDDLTTQLNIWYQQLTKTFFHNFRSGQPFTFDLSMCIKGDTPLSWTLLRWYNLLHINHHWWEVHIWARKFDDCWFAAVKGALISRTKSSSLRVGFFLHCAVHCTPSPRLPLFPSPFSNDYRGHFYKPYFSPFYFFLLRLGFFCQIWICP